MKAAKCSLGTLSIESVDSDFEIFQGGEEQEQGPEQEQEQEQHDSSNNLKNDEGEEDSNQTNSPHFITGTGMRSNRPFIHLFHVVKGKKQITFLSLFLSLRVLRSKKEI